MTFTRTTLTLCLMLLLMTGCGQRHAGSTILPHSTQTDVLTYLDDYQPSVRHAGQTITFDELADELRASRVIYIGERHDRYEHHLNQLALLRALHQRHPDLSIGVEWFQQPFQPVIDQYLAGDISEAQMLADTQYLDRWGYDYRMLRPILEFAKTENIPVIALNADVAITRKIGQSGLASLSESERAQLPATITPPPAEEMAMLKEIFSHHPEASSEDLTNFITVQRVWDLTMANAIVDHLKPHPNRKMVVYAGDGHLSKGRAIPAEVSLLEPTWPSTVVQSWIEMEDNHRGADYVVVSQAKQLPPIGKLGVWLENGDGGVLIKQVVENSAASEAGVQDGDLVTALEGQSVATSAELKIGLARYVPNDKIMLLIERNGEAMSKRVTLK